MEKISLCVLTYNHYELTHQLLADIRSRCQGVYEVIVLNNGSTDGGMTSGGLEFWKKLFAPMNFRVLTLEDNRNFIGGMNYMLPKAEGTFVVALSNDVRIRNRKFIDQLQQVAKEKVLVGGVVYRMDTGWNKFGDKIFPYAEGWCVGTTKAGWEELGYFDERYAPSDFEDVHLSTKALSLGYELVEIPDIHHAGGGTLGYTEERRQRTLRNQELFKKEWVK